MAEGIQVGKQVTRRSSDIDLEALLQQMIDHIGGLHKEVRASVKSVAAEIGVNSSSVQRVRTFAERVGGLDVRYTSATPGAKSPKGRHAWWTFVHDVPWMVAEAKRKWGLTALTFGELRDKMPGKRSSRTTEEVEKPVTTPEPKPETQIAAELQKVRKSEPEALLEAARQYAGREEFIEEELRRFHEMGIEIDRSAIKFETDERLETAVILLPFVDKLIAAIDRQSVRLGELRDTARDNAKVEELQAEVEELKKERRERSEATKVLADRHRLEMQSRDRRIRTLEAALQNEATKRLQRNAAPPLT